MSHMTHESNGKPYNRGGLPYRMPRFKGEIVFFFFFETPPKIFKHFFQRGTDSFGEEEEASTDLIKVVQTAWEMTFVFLNEILF